MLLPGLLVLAGCIPKDAALGVHVELSNAASEPLTEVAFNFEDVRVASSRLLSGKGLGPAVTVFAGAGRIRASGRWREAGQIKTWSQVLEAPPGSSFRIAIGGSSAVVVERVGE
jgi:hypothetical protein